MGLPKDLKLQDNDFTNAATSFFIAYLVAEIPNGKSSILPEDDSELICLQDTFSTKFRRASGSGLMSCSGALQQLAPQQRTITIHFSQLASSLVSSKQPLHQA